MLNAGTFPANIRCLSGPVKHHKDYQNAGGERYQVEQLKFAVLIYDVVDFRELAHQKAAYDRSQKRA